MVPGDEDGLEQALVVQATLTCDHRTVDGALGATWLQHFKKATEDPMVMLL
jgi:pyruvate dehydrogenase E2 component (dihydrolipoamide acetyltransferase)